MNKEDISRWQELFLTTVTEVGLKVLAAVAFWVIGRWLIGVAVGMVRASLERQKVDPTVLRYVGSIVTVTLNILLVIGILGYFGIQTTTFAALIAAAGVAIGMAWSGLLAHFAAGAFLVVLRPMKVGDFVTVAGVTGTVTELGLFTTVINTPDNVQTIIGNNKVFSDTIQNLHAQPFPSRRSEVPAFRRRRSSGGDGSAAREDRDNSERAGRAEGGCRDSRLHAGRAGAGGAPILPQRQLLAGLFRHQPDDSRSAGRGRFPGADAGAERDRHAGRLIAGFSQRKARICGLFSWSTATGGTQPRRRQISVCIPRPSGQTKVPGLAAVCSVGRLANMDNPGN